MKCKLFEIDDEDSFETMKQKIKNNEKCRNSILGKALEPCYNETCKIIVLVTLQ